MIKTFLFLFIIFLNSLFVCGQIVIKPAVNNNAKKIDQKIEVISNLPNPTILGFMPSEISNDRKYIRASEDVNEWLSNFVKRGFDMNGDSKAKEILWVIHDLSLGKDSALQGVHSFVKFKADIYENEKQSLNFTLKNTFDSTWIVNNSEPDFAQMIALAFSELYEHSITQKNATANKRFQQMSQKFTGTKDDIMQKIRLANSQPILTDREYKAGVYLSFNEFKNNSPRVPRFYVKTDNVNKKVILYEILPDSSSKVIEEAWGIAINNELYHYLSGQLYPIERSGNTFYIAKYLEPRTRRNQALYWRMYVGKRQGDSNPFNDAHILRKKVTDNNVSLETTHLDFDLEDFTH